MRVGRITGAHGLSGAVAARLDDSDSATLDSVARVFVNLNGELRECALGRVNRLGRGRVRIALAGIGDPEAAAGLRGAELMVATADLPPPAARGFYYYQVIGLEVWLGDGRMLGRVEEVFPNGAHDVWVVRGEGREVLVPVIADIVKELDLKARRATVEAVPGLLE